MKRFLSSALILALVAGVVGMRGVSADEYVVDQGAVTIGTDEFVRLMPNGEARLTGTVVSVTSTAPISPATTTTSTISNNVFTALMLGQYEVPTTTTSTATGAATVTLGAGDSATLSMQFSGLSGNETAAHIHGPATPTSTAAPIIPLPLGQITDHPFTITTEQRMELESGLWYVNVHSEAYPDGEIRGQLVVDTSTSTPSVLNEPAVTSTTTVSTSEGNGRTFLVVSAWGVNWLVEVTTSTSITHEGGGTLSASMIEPLDRINITGVTVTSTPIATSTSHGTVGPVIYATAVRDLSLDSRTITGIVIPGTIEIDPPGATTSTTFTTTFMVSTTNSGIVQVRLDETAKITMVGHTATIEEIIDTHDVNGMPIDVQITGVYNKSTNTLMAKTVTVLSGGQAAGVTGVTSTPQEI